MADKKEKFIIIDGNALIHRAFHALPPLTTKDGRLMNAAYGFTTILLKALKDLKPDYIAVTFDLKGPTFRHEQYVDYKATRKKQPDELYDQIPIVKDIVKAFNIKIFEKTGFEADDVIGTLCKHKQVDRPEMLSLIVTGDMDTLQLVDDNTQVFTLRKGMSDTIIYDVKGVKEKYNGLLPGQMIDYKALRGDVSDNIPGVKGIGEKTAIDLLLKFKTLENLYQEIEKNSGKAQSIKERIRNLLVEFKSDALMSKDLATIRQNVEIDFNLEDCRVQDYDREEILKLFSELQFNSLLARLPETKTQANIFEETTKTTGEKHQYSLIDNEIDFAKFLRELKKQKVFVFDTETTSLEIIEAQLLGISFSWEKGRAFYVVIKGEQGKEFLKQLKPIFENHKIKKVAHNMKYDAAILHTHGIMMANYYFDTMIASYLFNPGVPQNSLDYLAFSRLKHKMISIQELIGSGKNQISMAEVPDAKVAEYSGEDADYTWQLYEMFKDELETEKLAKLFYEIEMPLIEVLIEMELNGVKIDAAALKELSHKVTRKINTLKKKIYEMAGKEFNINSPLQLKEILFDVLQIPVQGLKRTKTGISTAAAELDKLKGEHEIIDLIGEYRELSKLKSTYLDTLPKLIKKKTGRIHTSFNQTITATGRLSSTNPNLQNIPIRTELGREIRQAFIPEKGYRLIAADYSQVELRVIACLAQDQEMMKVFREGKDIHAATAAKIFDVKLDEVTKEMRRKAKEVNFGVLYGMGSVGLAQRTGISRAEAKEFIQKYFDSYKKVKQYTLEMVDQAREKQIVETMFGRKRNLPDINSGVQMIRAGAERMAVNMPIQGTAADLMKIAMIAVYRELKKKSPKTRILMQVHDELVFEVPKDEIDKVAKIIDNKMEKIHQLCVPIKVDTEVGNNWDQMEKIY